MPPLKPIRRSQLISPFGIGSMVDFPRDETLMTAGLDAWPYAKEPCPPQSGWLIVEERLQIRLGVSHFRLPSDFRDPMVGLKYPNQRIPFVRFPRWHYCHICGGMEHLPLYSPTPQRCAGRRYTQHTCANKPERKRPFLIPMRFVAVCPHGHIEDFPFMEWVHRTSVPSPSCKLRARAGRSSAGLTGITIECLCGAHRTMGGVFEFDESRGGPLHRIGFDCNGVRPWLGESENPRGSCGQFLRVVQRGASNVYFPYVVSSIYLPFWAEGYDRDIIRALEDPTVWSVLATGSAAGKVAHERAEIIAQMRGLDVQELAEAANKKLSGQLVPQDPEGYSDEHSRYHEYQALMAGRGGEKTDLYVRVADLGQYSPWISSLFARVGLVHKMRETRVLAGFTRILPPEEPPQPERVQSLKLDATIDWLPGILVRGEGIFLQLNSASMSKWISSTPIVVERIKHLAQQYNHTRHARGQADMEIQTKFVMMHTLAHSLINQLSYDCGYGSASLRERIYCDSRDLEHPMEGILIYTASGDSEGTLGGLVRQALRGRLERTIERSLQRAEWCSYDPVCIESQGQGTDNSNLAACHGCVLLPETSCEWGNRLLDRATLVGLPKDQRLGFLHYVV